MNKPFSQACENNKGPILDVLQRHLKGHQNVLEVGSGTGQHAVFFGEQFPDIAWQTADLADNHPAIMAWLEEAWAEGRCQNVCAPMEIHASKIWPEQQYDAIFSANTLHIMSLPNVEQFFPGAASCLERGGVLMVYGPFNYNGAYTSESNARFDQWLKDRDPQSAIRHFENVNELAGQQGFALKEDNAMPANNRLLVWEKVELA